MRCASFRLSHHPSSLFSSSTNTSSDSTAAFVHVPAHARPSCEQQRARRVASCRRRVSLRTRVQRPDVSAGPPPYNPYHKHLQPPPPAPSDPAPSSSMMSGPGGAAQRRSRRTAAAAAAASVPAAAMSTHYAPNPAASFQQSPPPPPPHLPHAPGPSASSSTTATTSPTSIHGGSTTTDRASLRISPTTCTSPPSSCLSEASPSCVDASTASSMPHSTDPRGRWCRRGQKNYDPREGDTAGDTAVQQG
ncbi:hypothetical protein A4X06_0g5822 [Tilletia controversa]|uniref:Uncharacterized protein n=1 Tax=Tilletia controversa TaxID=13291 RepID=A0A8X7SV68_9BASI|nr:hypothetical protein A4X06_0g5822 [Tilletia controversa]